MPYIMLHVRRSSCVLGRDATRRRKETEVLSELVKSLPLQRNEVDYVTQIKGLKLAIQYFRLHKVVKSGGMCVQNNTWLNDFLKQKTKFLLVVENSGTIMYASERITQLLGLLQVDIIGAQFSEVVHSEDHEEFSQLLTDRTVHSHLIRMKDTLSPNTKHKGNFQCRVMHVSVLGFSKEESFSVLECEPFETASILEITISTYIDYTVNACTKIITDADWKLEMLSGFSREDVIGSNVLLYLFPNDIEITDEKHEQLMELVLSKGVVSHPPYRVISGHGEWYWARMEIRPNKVKNGKIVEMKCRTQILSPDSVAGFVPRSLLSLPHKSTSLPLLSTSNVSVDYSSLPSLSDLPTSNPPSVCSSSGCSSGEVSCSTEPLSDLSVEDVLGPPNDTLNDSGSHPQHFQSDQLFSNPLPSLPSVANVTEDIMELLLH